MRYRVRRRWIVLVNGLENALKNALKNELVDVT